MTTRRPTLSPDDPPIRDAEFVEGADKAEEMLRSWIGGISKSADCEQGFVVRLMQHGRGGLDKQICDFEYKYDLSLEDFIGDVIECANEFTLAARKAVQFAARVEIPNPNGASTVKRRLFTLRAPLSQFEEDDPLDQPSDYTTDAEGVTGLAVDMAKAFAKNQLHQQDKSEARYERHLDRLESENTNLRRENEALRARMHEVADMQWARDDARDRQKREDERKDKLFGMLAQGGKLLLAQMAGGGMPPGLLGGSLAGIAGLGEGDPDGEPPDLDPIDAATISVVDDLISAMTAEQVQKLMMSGILTEEQLMGLGKLHKLSLERAERRSRQPPDPTRENVNGHANGHANGAGRAP